MIIVQQLMANAFFLWTLNQLDQILHWKLVRPKKVVLIDLFGGNDLDL